MPQQKLDGDYNSIDYDVSINMRQLQGQKWILGHIWPQRNLDSWPIDPKMWRIHPCRKVG